MEPRPIPEKEIPKVDEVSSHSLVGLVMSLFEEARAHKLPIEERLLECMRAFRFEYSPSKLAQIRSEIGGSEIYVPLTNMKVRAGKAWLTEVFFQPGERLFSLKPTPVPELPPEIENEMKEEVKKRTAEVSGLINRLSIMSNGAFKAVGEDVLSKKEREVEEELRREINSRSKELCKKAEDMIEDQLVEGGFYDAFSKLLLDIMIYPTAILKGPILRRVRKFVSSNKDVIEETIPTYNRVSPFDIYPAPYASNFDDGYIIETLHLTPRELSELKGLEGFIDEAIDRAIGQYLYETTIAPTEVGASQDTDGDGNPDTAGTLTVYEFWGSVKGEYLIDLDIGVDKNMEDEWFDICAWVCKGELIKIILNPDPLRRKPYVKASFVEIPDSFWGIALPEILEPIQSAVNAICRAMINNAVMSSGPLIERNMDRLGNAGSDDGKIKPFKIFDVHESALNSAPAYRFYQLAPTADRLIVILQTFQRMADEYSGIPAYAHGDVTVGGAGRTYSGLAMLTANASRGIKDVIKNIDDGIIRPLIEMQYYYNMYNYNLEEIPDLSIQARGSINLLEKQAQTARMLEFLQLTSNPVDLQYLGDGRRSLLESIARNIGLDVETLFLANNVLNQLGLQMPGGGFQPPMPKINEVSPIAETAVTAQREAL